MGDSRFEQPLLAVKEARDRKAAIDDLSYDELVLALGAASRDRDPYFANVFTSELLNRSRRGTAAVFSAGLGVAASIALFFLVAGLFASHPRNFDDHLYLTLALVTMLAGAVGAILAHSPILHRLTHRRV